MNCELCFKEIVTDSKLSTRYGRDKQDRIVCYSCCAILDRIDMSQHGDTVLYLSNNEVTNWPGSLRFPVNYWRKGKHNIARNRYDVWFKGPDGFVWHGVQYGDYTHLCHCKKTRIPIATEVYHD